MGVIEELAQRHLRDFSEDRPVGAVVLTPERHKAVLREYEAANGKPANEPGMIGRLSLFFAKVYAADWWSGDELLDERAAEVFRRQWDQRNPGQCESERAA